jgi:homocysteine S-methyltransferase
MQLPELLARHPFLPAEGAVVERLRRMPGIVLDPVLEHAALIYDERGARAMEAIYRQYLDIAAGAGLPMLCFTPTWRASQERLARAGLADRDANADAFRFLSRIRAGYGEASRRILIGGLAGCAGDAYRPAAALDEETARRYHKAQLDALARAGADFLFASTLPAASEAAGLARAMSETGLPYIVSFVLDRRGCLLDGTPLSSVIRSIDARVSPPPEGYMMNCVHPAVCESALARMDAAALGRILGLQANTSARDPRELDGLPGLETESPEVLADAMYALHRRFGLRILGGCCGTDDSHIRAIVYRCFPQ